jgi:cell division protein FtsN
MVTRPATDPTEGERARSIREHPDLVQPIFDPTDPRAAGRPRRRTPRRPGVPVRDLERPARER